MPTRKPVGKFVAVVAFSSALGVLMGLAVSNARSVRRHEPPTLRQPTTLGERVRLEWPKTQPLDPQLKSPSARARGNGAESLHPFRDRSVLYAYKQAEQERRMTTYAGTRINPNAIDGLPYPKARQAIAEAFARIDPKPLIRAQHFQWLDQHKDLNPQGRAGCITRIDPDPKGWQVEIHISPVFQPAGGIVQTIDQCIERYLFVDGDLVMIPFKHQHPKKMGLIFD